jgi:hypothetical protein
MSLRIASFGAEHEWADHPLDRDPPPGFGRDVRDITIVNSNGIANDPKGKAYRFGGEFNTPPTDTIEGQVGCLQQLREHYPEATINYRSNLHLHVRVPGLRNDLQALKLFQAHIHQYLPSILAKVVEPIPVPSAPIQLEDSAATAWLQGAKRRFRRRRVSHQSFLTNERLAIQAQAQTVDRWFELEVPQTKDTNKPLWHLQPRLAVSLRQLLQTDTIEFRHFPGTMSKNQLRVAFNWVREYTEHALAGLSVDGLAQEYEGAGFPRFLPYHHDVECGYRATVHDGTVLPGDMDQEIMKRAPHLDRDRIKLCATGYAHSASFIEGTQYGHFAGLPVGKVTKL